jgi:hypothetical protein
VPDKISYVQLTHFQLCTLWSLLIWAQHHREWQFLSDAERWDVLDQFALLWGMDRLRVEEGTERPGGQGVPPSGSPPLL